MPLFALALIAIGLVAGGWRLLTGQADKKPAAFPPFRLAALPVLGFGLQWLALRWAGGEGRAGLFALSHALLLLFLIANARFLPLWPLSAGYVLNLVAMSANGGYMPITPEAMAALHPETAASQWSNGLIRVGSKDIVLPAVEAAFWFLGDVLVLAHPFPVPTAFSIGDVLILAGFAWAVVRIR